MSPSKQTSGANYMNRKPGCPIPLSSGCLHGLPLPSSFEKGIKMKCSNTQCAYQDRLMHPECFRALEDNLIKIMSNIAREDCLEKRKRIKNMGPAGNLK